MKTNTVGIYVVLASELYPYAHDASARTHTCMYTCPPLPTHTTWQTNGTPIFYEHASSTAKHLLRVAAGTAGKPFAIYIIQALFWCVFVCWLVGPSPLTQPLPPPASRLVARVHILCKHTRARKPLQHFAIARACARALLCAKKEERNSCARQVFFFFFLGGVFENWAHGCECECVCVFARVRLCGNFIHRFARKRIGVH